jgi:pSer/pThr/pTyr-binding forkhead associated (FHA) protein
LARLLHDALSGGEAIPTPIPTSGRGVERPHSEARPVPERISAPVIKPVTASVSAVSPRVTLPPADDISDQELSDFLLDALSGVESPPSFDADERPVVHDEGLFKLPSRPSSANITSQTMPALAPAAPAQAVPSPGVRCGSCDGLNPEGMLYCVYCGSSLEGAAAQFIEPEGQDDAADCPSCGHKNPLKNTFCGACGHKLSEPSGAQSSPPASGDAARPVLSSTSMVARKPALDVRLISINEDGSDGLEVPLEQTKTIVGRTGDTRFPTDAFLSPKHACLTVEQHDLLIEDLYSLNGTFVRLREEVVLTPGDVVLMGRQVLRFEKFEQTITPKARSSDGTRYMGSPLPGGNFKLLQVGIGGVIQNVYCIPETGAVLGREKGDIIFPRDKFMSGRHAQIYPREDSSYALVDLNSSNGTWIKIWEKTRLQNGDFIFMGQQLFRIDIRDPRAPAPPRR